MSLDQPLPNQDFVSEIPNQWSGCCMFIPEVPMQEPNPEANDKERRMPVIQMQLHQSQDSVQPESASAVIHYLAGKKRKGSGCRSS